MIYLDNSATTRPFDDTLEAMAHAAREGYFNPSSLYAQAMEGGRLLSGAKSAVQGALGAADGTVVFTSGGTESDNLAILGAAANLRGKRGHFLYGAAEHPAVAQAMEALRGAAHDVQVIPVDSSGAVSPGVLRGMLREDTALVSVQHVNNEVGAVNPIEELAALVHEVNPRALFHTDAVQAFLRVPVRAREIDLYSLSAHKFHGPRGIGALWMSRRVKLMPIVHGGGQQNGLRSGTENTPGAAGMRAAIDTMRSISGLSDALMQKKLCLHRLIMEAVPDARVNGPAPLEGAPHILNMSFDLRGEILLHALEGEGILVSTGSACSSRRKRPSDTLTAMGCSPETIEGALRFSLSPMNTMEEMEMTAEALGRLVPQYRRYRRK